MHLQLRQAQAGDIVLRHADESKALTHPYLADIWAEQGADLRGSGAGPGAQDGDIRRTSRFDAGGA